MRRLGLPAAVALVVIAVGVAQLVHGAMSGGVTLDEQTHVERTFGWLAHGWYVPEPYLINGFPDPANPLSTPFVYGPAFSSIAHLANFELGNEPLANVSFSADAYAVRHLLAAALAALAVVAAGGLVWLFTGSWRFGLWAAACLLAIPVFLGHGFFNPKDVPTATGYTLVTAGLALALAAGPPSRRRLLAVVALLAGGTFIGAGTRLALWAPIFASVLAYAALRLGQRWRGGLAGGWRHDAAVLLGGAIGAAAIALLYPAVAEMPRTLLTQAVSTSADYPNGTTTLTAGQLLPSNPPWWYLPTWVGAQLPLLIGALAALGAGLALAVAVRAARGRGPSSAWSEPQLGLILVLLQATLLPLLAIAGGATMYDATRQHLYLFPAFAVLAGIGAERVWRWARERPSGRTRPALAAGVLSLALLVPMAEQTILFPYNYAYVNAVAGAGGVNGRWETDYWYLSNREAFAKVPRDTRLRCSTRLTLASRPEVEPEFGSCGRQPFAAERGSRAATTRGGDTRTWVVSWPRGANLPPPWCEETANVTRWLRGEDVTMAYVLRCDTRQVKARETPG